MKKELIYLIFALLSLIFLNIVFAVAEDNTSSVEQTNSATTQTSIETTTTQTNEQTTPTTETTSERTEDSTKTSTTDSSERTQTEENTVKSAEDLEKLESEFKKEELEINTGITPDSNLYFIEDKILSRFRDDLENRERKVGEIREMIKKGDIEAARIALERYKRYSESLEKELDPKKREEARRSAAAIYNTLKEIESELPKEDKKEFIDDVLDREKIIVTAAEIANKIKALCEQLAELDPSEYSKVCIFKENAPKWQKKLNQELTKEQEKEAKEFGVIMSECFKTSGKECKCKDISFYDFSVACNKIAPLASACDSGDENACEEMESVDMPELPPYLQSIFDDIESKYKGDQIDMHMPKECVRVGARDKKSCMMVMFKLNAPDECVEALKQGKINPSDEKEARKACDEIMFKLNAPDECVEAGITNPKECGAYMFKINAPEECIEAGLTGESRSDEKKCREIMETKKGESERGASDRGLSSGGRGAPGSKCMQIQNPQERLICFEEAVGKMGEDYGVGDKFKEVEGKITPECRENRIHEPSDCERFMREELPQVEKQRQEDKEKRNERYKEREREIFQPGEMKCPDGVCDEFERNNPYACPEDCGGQREERREGDFRGYEESECKDGCSQECPGASRTDCVDNGRRCQCFYEENRAQPQEPLQPAPTPAPTPTPEPAPVTESTPTPEPAPVTGGVIGVNNKFLDYWFKR